MASLRQMEIDDIEQIVDMDRGIFPDPWSETGLFTYLIRNDTVFLVAEEDGEIAGFCGAQTAADEADIITVAVDEKMRKKGIGKQLVDELVKRTGELGARNIYLEVRSGNKAAKALYENYGFERIGIRKNYYSDPKEDAITMKYEINTERK